MSAHMPSLLYLCHDIHDGSSYQLLAVFLARIAISS